MKIITRQQIEKIAGSLDLIPLIEQGFVAYSQGKAVVPPVGELLFKDPPGEVHIKYGYLTGDDCYVIKIASGFSKNSSLGMPNNTGMMLLFSQKTGWPMGILLDEGLLTALRTAVAGAIAAKYLAPKKVRCIGIVGTGNQGLLQLRHLKPVVACRDVLVWGIHREKAEHFAAEMRLDGYSIQAAASVAEIGGTCNLIVTTTPSHEPLLLDEHVQKGTHITAIGSDTPEKQELDSRILARADLVVADSIEQCLLRGEIHQALKRKLIQKKNLAELGDVIQGRASRRDNDDQITVADLTGVAVQDLQIAKAVYHCGLF